jgi:hypothetical protein
MADDLADWLREFRAALNAALPGAMGNSRWDSGDDWTKRSREACPDDLMKQIVEDNRRGGDIHGRASVIPPPKAQQSEEPQNRSGWVDPPKIRPPEGIEHVDRLVDMQDKLDAAARARQLGLSPEEWSRLSEADLKARKEQQAKKVEVKSEHRHH